MNTQRKKWIKILTTNGSIAFLMGIVVFYTGGMYFTLEEASVPVQAILFVMGGFPGVLLVAVGYRTHHFARYLRPPLKEAKEKLPPVSKAWKDYFMDYPLRKKGWLSLVVGFGLWLVFFIGKGIALW